MGMHAWQRGGQFGSLGVVTRVAEIAASATTRLDWCACPRRRHLWTSSPGPLQWHLAIQPPLDERRAIENR
jgi:hypothetical protein